MKKGVIAILSMSAVFIGSSFCAAAAVEYEIEQLKKEIAEMKASKEKGSISEYLGLAAEIGATFVLQGVNKSNDGSNKGRTDGSYSLDLGFGKEFSDGAKVFLHIEGLQGEGLNDNLRLYSSLNTDAGTTESFLSVSELWYQQNLFGDKITLTFGKLNPAGYFDENEIANDETGQFLASMFVNNPAVSLPDNNPGLRMTYSPAGFLDITYAYFNQNEDLGQIDGNGFNAVQAAFKYSGKGNYRLMYWSSNEDAGSENSYGFSISFDRPLNETVSLFARYGYKNPKIADDENPVANSWSFGAQFKGALLNRENDIAGLAFGQNIVSKDWAEANGLKKDAETQAEIYYKLSISENMELTPVFQYAVKPMGGNAAAGGDLFAFGIRTQINF
ncbi:MAG: carbohydrate porin [Endomicrobium sp.]|jgi:carbohydrate-selective porin OprB|nr:carbohydrate porin [Endomicrobium sp.]